METKVDPNYVSFPFEEALEESPFVDTKDIICATCAYGCVRVTQRMVSVPRPGAEPLDNGSLFGPKYDKEDLVKKNRRSVDVYCSNPRFIGNHPPLELQEEVIYCQGHEEREDAV